AEQAGGVSTGEAALWVSATAGAVATKRRTGEPQAVASGVSGGGIGDPAEEAKALRAGGKAAGGANFSQSGVGAGLCARRGRVRPNHPRAERGGCLHTRVSGVGSRHQFRQPESDASAGSNCGRTRTAVGDPLRQWAGVDQPAFSGVVYRAADRVSAHSAGKADAEWASRKLSRTAAGRVSEP